MLTVPDLLDQLPEAAPIALGRAIGGVRSARHAAVCMTEPGTQAQTVGQLLAQLRRAIGELGSARDLVQQWSQGTDRNGAPSRWRRRLSAVSAAGRAMPARRRAPAQLAAFRGAGMTDDDYAAQMRAAVDREVARTTAEGNCVARTKDGDLCRRRIAQALRAKGITHCRIHVAAPKRPPSRP